MKEIARTDQLIPIGKNAGLALTFTAYEPEAWGFFAAKLGENFNGAVAAPLQIFATRAERNAAAAAFLKGTK